MLNELIMLTPAYGDDNTLQACLKKLLDSKSAALVLNHKTYVMIRNTQVYKNISKEVKSVIDLKLHAGGMH